MTSLLLLLILLTRQRFDRLDASHFRKWDVPSRKLFTCKKNNKRELKNRKKQIMNKHL